MKLYDEVFPVEIFHPYLADCEMIMTAGEGVKDFCKVLYRGTRSRTREEGRMMLQFSENRWKREDLRKRSTHEKAKRCGQSLGERAKCCNFVAKKYVEHFKPPVGLCRETLLLPHWASDEFFLPVLQIVAARSGTRSGLWACAGTARCGLSAILASRNALESCCRGAVAATLDQRCSANSRLGI